MRGDQTLFNRSDMVEETWRVVQPVLDAWSAGLAQPVQSYASGRDGPDAAFALLQTDGRSWRPVGSS